MRRRLAIVAAVSLLVSCGGGGDGGGGDNAAPASTAAPMTTSSSSTTTPSTTTTPEPPDPFTVPEDPADIDEAYVEAVVNEHNRVIGDALRIQLEGGDVQEIIDRYNAIYVPEVADLLLTDALNESDADMAEYTDPPGDVIVDVESLRHAGADCVSAFVLQDMSALLREEATPVGGTVVLRSSSSAATSSLNRTPWMSEGLIPDDTAVDRCAA